MQSDMAEVAAVAEQSSASSRAGLRLDAADQRLHPADRRLRAGAGRTAEQLEQLVGQFSLA